MMKNVEPQKEHLWLKRLVGNWTSEMAMPAGPDKPPETFRGTEAGRTLGDVWVLLEGKGPMVDGSSATTLFQLGYDTTRKTFVGTFIGSMMTHLWVYDSGELDESGKVLTLNAEGPDFSTEGKTAKYKDKIEFVDDDYRVLTSHTPGPDGQWVQFMKAEYRRVK
jgi:hypothetical protein